MDRIVGIVSHQATLAQAGSAKARSIKSNHISNPGREAMELSLIKLRPVGMLAIVVLAIGLSACGSNSNLPTVGGQTGSSPPGLSQVARSYLDCMVADNIPVELTPNSQGEMAIVAFSSGHDVMWRFPDGVAGVQSAASGSIDTTQAQQDFLNSTGPRLIVDGVDHTDVFVACLNQSGYDHMAAFGTATQVDPQKLQEQLESNNRWAACAREHGWPGIRDSVVPTNSGPMRWPMVTLPSDITEDQLRQLLKDCPNFDPDQAQCLVDQETSNGKAGDAHVDCVPDPMITVDWSSLGGDPFDPSWTPKPDQQSENDRLNRLMDILWEAQMDYWATHPPQ